jgi:hypothetical protein
MEAGDVPRLQPLDFSKFFSFSELGNDDEDDSERPPPHTITN